MTHHHAAEDKPGAHSAGGDGVFFHDEHVVKDPSGGYRVAEEDVTVEQRQMEARVM